MLIIYILTAENLGVFFSFFLEKYAMDFSQTLPFSSLYCSQGYRSAVLHSMLLQFMLWLQSTKFVKIYRAYGANLG